MPGSAPWQKAAAGCRPLLLRGPARGLWAQAARSPLLPGLIASRRPRKLALLPAAHRRKEGHSGIVTVCIGSVSDGQLMRLGGRRPAGWPRAAAVEAQPAARGGGSIAAWNWRMQVGSLIDSCKKARPGMVSEQSADRSVAKHNKCNKPLSIRSENDVQNLQPA
jgi:hypothetical protein